VGRWRGGGGEGVRGGGSRAVPGGGVRSCDIVCSRARGTSAKPKSTYTNTEIYTQDYVDMGHTHGGGSTEDAPDGGWGVVT